MRLHHAVMFPMVLHFTGQTCEIPDPETVNSVAFRSDLAYRTVGRDTLRLDFARAPRPEALPLVIVVHGGGWRAGSKSERLAPVIRRLAAGGYAVASVGYRLTTDPATRFPAALEDVWCALTWLTRHADSLGIDARRVAMVGESAGGQLAAMTAYAPSVASRACGQPELASRIRGVIGMYGIYDLLALTDQPRAAQAVEHNLGLPPHRDSALARRASPVSYAPRQAVPILLVHGTADRSVHVDQSRRMEMAVRQSGAEATVVEVPGADHGFPMVSDDTSLHPSSCAVLAFLQKHLREAARTTALPQAVRQGQNYRILAHDFAFTLPTRVPAGLVRMRLINDGHEPHYMAIMRADSGKGMADFLAWRTSRTPRPAWLTPAGGHGTIAAGDSLGLALHMSAGKYIVFCGYPSPDGTSHVAKGMIGEIVVEDLKAEPVADPTSNATVRLTDYSVSIPVGLRAGRQTIRVVNESAQQHQLLIVKLPDGVTAAQDLAWFTGGFRGPRPGVPFGGLIQIGGGQTAWASMTYTPGRYLLLCNVFDPTGRSHHSLGMHGEFVVP